MAELKGTFYGVSIGPGDPELMTLQTVRLIRQCPVLAAPQTASGQMLALTSPAVRWEKRWTARPSSRCTLP